MAKPELGTKRVCVSCGARFYDLLKQPAVCPKCGTEQPVEQPAPRRMPAAATWWRRPPPEEPAPAPGVEEAEIEVEGAEEEDEEDVLEDTADLEDDAENWPTSRSSRKPTGNGVSISPANPPPLEGGGWGRGGQAQSRRPRLPPSAPAPSRLSSPPLPPASRPPAQLTPEVLDALHGAGLFRCLLPRACNGEEAHPADYAAMVEIIAAADASTAWCIGQGSGCSMAAAYLKPEIARAIWANDPARCSPGACGLASPRRSWTAAIASPANGSFASGSRHAQWMGAHCTVQERDGSLRLGRDGHPVDLTILFPQAPPPSSTTGR